MLRYLLAREWWPAVQTQDHQFVIGETTVQENQCFLGCSFVQRRARGNAEKPFYVEDRGPREPPPIRRSIIERLSKFLGNLFPSR